MKQITLSDDQWTLLIYAMGLAVSKSDYRDKTSIFELTNFMVTNRLDLKDQEDQDKAEDGETNKTD